MTARAAAAVPFATAGDGKARTREVKLACLFTQTSVDDDGHPVRDPASTTCLATFEPAERFGDLLDAEARLRGCEHTCAARMPATAGTRSGSGPAARQSRLTPQSS
jgi:hypothetical protein